jgi:hypothetical protein
MDIRNLTKSLKEGKAMFEKQIKLGLLAAGLLGLSMMGTSTTARGQEQDLERLERPSKNNLKEHVALNELVIGELLGAIVFIEKPRPNKSELFTVAEPEVVAKTLKDLATQEYSSKRLVKQYLNSISLQKPGDPEGLFNVSVWQGWVAEELRVADPSRYLELIDRHLGNLAPGYQEKSVSLHGVLFRKTTGADNLALIVTCERFIISNIKSNMSRKSSDSRVIGTCRSTPLKNLTRTVDQSGNTLRMAFEVPSTLDAEMISTHLKDVSRVEQKYIELEINKR